MDPEQTALLDAQEAKRLLLIQHTGVYSQEARAPCVQKYGPRRDFRALHFKPKASNPASHAQIDAYDQYNIPRQMHSEVIVQQLNAVIERFAQEYHVSQPLKAAIQDELETALSRSSLPRATVKDSVLFCYQQLDDLLVPFCIPDFTLLVYEVVGNIIDQYVPTRSPVQSAGRNEDSSAPVSRPATKKKPLTASDDCYGDLIGSTSDDIQHHLAQVTPTISSFAAIADITAFARKQYYVIIIGDNWQEDGFASQLHHAHTNRKYDITMLAIGKTTDSKYSDLSQPRSYQFWSAFIKSGNVIGMYSKPGTTTWNDYHRSALFPWGKQQLRPAHYDAIHEENVRIQVSLDFFALLIPTGGFAVIRHGSLPKWNSLSCHACLLQMVTQCPMQQTDDSKSRSPWGTLPLFQQRSGTSACLHLQIHIQATNHQVHHCRGTR